MGSCLRRHTVGGPDVLLHVDGSNTGARKINVARSQRRLLRGGKAEGARGVARTLHWFRWEAAVTWVSGMLLLIIVYYLGGLMENELLGGVRISVLVAFLLLVTAWFIYEPS